MSKKTKSIGQLPYRTKEWAEARLKERPGRLVDEKVVLATTVAQVVSLEDRPKRIRTRL